MKRYIIISILLLFSCQNNKIKESKDIIFNNIDNIKEVKLSLSGTITYDSLIVSPSKLKIHDSIAFILNSNADVFISIVNIKTKAILGNMITKGKAINEFTSTPYNIIINEETNEISFQEFYGGKYLNYSIDSIIYHLNNNTPELLKPMQNFYTSQCVSNILKISNKKYLATVYDSNIKSRLINLDSAGNISSYKSMYFDGYGENIEKEIYPLAFSCDVSISYKDSIFVLTNRYMDLIEFYDFDGNLLKYSIGPFMHKVKFENKIIGNISTMKPGSENRFAYNMPIIESKKLWVRYDGRTLNEKKTGYIDSILSFDLNGILECIYIIDDDYCCFDVDEETKTIYTMKQDDDCCTIYKYKY